MSDVKFEPAVSMPQSPILRLLLKQIISYIGYLMTSFSLVVWASVVLLMIGFYSQEAVIAVLGMLIEWGGDTFAPLAEGGHLVFNSDRNQVGQNDVNGAEAVLYIAGKISLVLYVLGTLLAVIFRKPISLSTASKYTFVRRFSLAAFFGIWLSSILRFETGVAPDSLFITGFLAIFLAPTLLLSGCWSIFCNDLIRQIIEQVDREPVNPRRT